jgi:hypothetical protein
MIYLFRWIILIGLQIVFIYSFILNTIYEIIRMTRISDVLVHIYLNHLYYNEYPIRSFSSVF